MQIQYLKIAVLGLQIALWAYFLNYFDDLKDRDCKCGLTTRRTILQVCLGITIAGLVIMILDSTSAFTLPMAIATGLGVVLMITSIVFIITTWQFTARMRRIDCDCAQTTAYKVLSIVNMLQILLIVVMIALVIIAGIPGSGEGSGGSKKSKK